MKIFPAIDLFDGQAVRLYKGDYDRMTVYDPEPLNTVRKFEAAGASCLHLVDLEGARTGKTTNLPTIEKLAARTGLFIEVGGGIRTMETVRRYLDAGAGRVILGTAAVTDPDFTAEAVARYGEKIAVGADLKDGKVAIKGWLETTGETGEAFLEKMQVLPSEHGNNAHAIWQEAWKGVARQAVAAGDRTKADRALARYREYPENLGLGKPFPKEE